jgi:hypothetical protein
VKITIYSDHSSLAVGQDNFSFPVEEITRHRDCQAKQQANHPTCLLNEFQAAVVTDFQVDRVW